MAFIVDPMVLDAHHRRDEGREKQGFEVDTVEHGVFSPALCQGLPRESRRFSCPVRALAFFPGLVSAADFWAIRVPRLPASGGQAFAEKCFKVCATTEKACMMASGTENRARSKTRREAVA